MGISVVATAAFADVENQYTVHRYSTRVELVRSLEKYRSQPNLYNGENYDKRQTGAVVRKKSRVTS